MGRSSRVEAARITHDDPRFPDLVRRGFNKRFVPRPDHVRVVTEPGQVVDVVQDTVREGWRVVARSGEHCLEGFVGSRASTWWPTCPCDGCFLERRTV